MKSLLSILLASALCLAQKPPQFFSGTEFNPNIPTPQSVLGHEIGDRFTDYRNMEKYIEKLTASSDRVKRIFYGETYEHRPLQVLVVTSPKNLARLDAIRTQNLKLTDPRNFKAKNGAEELIGGLPVMVWLAYGVHGNESSSPEAALLTLYQLCAGTDAKTLNLLDNAVVIIDPNVNPDGRERYVQWNNSVSNLVPNTSPEAREHNDSWPGGRSNHYYFDLNRDWAWLTQRETQARIKLYREWMPHVYVDYHEMSYQSSYFFFPAQAPFHTEFPEEVKKWGKIFGRGNAEAFDKLGIAYFTGEQFDLLYPGFGDTWPTFNGAIGMTYEQGGGAGLAIRKRTGQILTLRERARNHFVTSFASIETAVKNRKERIQDFYRHWESGLANTGKVKGFIIREDKDPNRAAEMANILLQQGIEVHQMQESVTLEAQKFYAKKSARESFPKGTYFVSMMQPASHLAKALLEPQTTVTDTFFYDVAAWSLPVAYGLTAYSTESPLPANAAKIQTARQQVGQVIGGKAMYAYLVPSEQQNGLKLIRHLLEKNYLLSVATRSFEMSNKYFPAGTVIALVGNNIDSIHSDMISLAARYGIEIVATNTGMTDKGISLSSDRSRPLIKSRIAVLTDSPFFSSDFGELWYLFEQRFDIPFTAIRSRDFGRAPLNDYDVLIFSDASDLREVLDSSNVDKVKRWIGQGGVLIGLDGSARALTKSRGGFTSVTLLAEKKEEEKTKEEKEFDKQKKETEKRQTLFEKEETARRLPIPGSVFKAIVDTTHPIGFGSPREIYVFKGDGGPIELSEAGHNVIRFSPDTTEVSGYVNKERSKKLAESAYVQDIRMGRGRVVLFAENMTFRMFWAGLNKYLMNAIMFLPEPK